VRAFKPACLTGLRGAAAALAIGPAVRPAARSSAVLSHYSLLRTIEDAWRLPRLGGAGAAAPVTGIWQTPSRNPVRGAP
jgi:hypothetical protein